MCMAFQGGQKSQVKLNIYKCDKSYINIFNNIKVYLDRSIREWQYISYEKSNIKKARMQVRCPAHVHDYVLLTYVLVTIRGYACAFAHDLRNRSLTQV